MSSHLRAGQKPNSKLGGDGLLPFATSDSGMLATDATLRVLDQPRVFAIGDTASAETADANSFPSTAQARFSVVGWHCRAHVTPDVTPDVRLRCGCWRPLSACAAMQPHRLALALPPLAGSRCHGGREGGVLRGAAGGGLRRESKAAGSALFSFVTLLPVWAAHRLLSHRLRPMRDYRGAGCARCAAVVTLGRSGCQASQHVRAGCAAAG